MKVTYISNEEIAIRASSFLKKYHPTLNCPIPIEPIADSTLGLFILPLKNLESVCEVDGYISGDFTTISIDQRVYETQEDRARFTIAHELGHLELHKEIYESRRIKNTQEFIEFQNNLNQKEWRMLEIQAHLFAEAILFPKEKFDLEVENSVLALGGLDNIVVQDIQTIINVLKKKFFVSGRCAYNKLKRDFPIVIEVVETNLPF